MTLGELFAGGCGGLVFVLSLVELAPVRWNPVGWLLRRVGRLLNADLLARVEDLSADVQSLNAELERQQAKTCRANIIRFGDELLHNTLHSKENFDQVLLDISEYERYCVEHPDFPNGVAVLTIARIKDVYGECLKEHSFL